MFTFLNLCRTLNQRITNNIHSQFQLLKRTQRMFVPRILTTYVTYCTTGWKDIWEYERLETCFTHVSIPNKMWFWELRTSPIHLETLTMSANFAETCRNPPFSKISTPDVLDVSQFDDVYPFLSPDFSDFPLLSTRSSSWEPRWPPNWTGRLNRRLGFVSICSGLGFQGLAEFSDGFKMVLRLFDWKPSLKRNNNCRNLFNLWSHQTREGKKITWLLVKLVKTPFEYHRSTELIENGTANHSRIYLIFYLALLVTVNGHWKQPFVELSSGRLGPSSGVQLHLQTYTCQV